MDEIASTLSNVPLSTLKKWAKRVKTKGNLVPLKSPGRPEKLNERDVRHLVSKAKRNPSLSIKSVTEHAGLSICHRTAVKYLKTANLCSIVAVKKPKLTEAHRQGRLRWVGFNRDKDLDAWKLCNFADECSIHRDCSEGQVRYIITPQQRYHHQFIDPKLQQGGGKLMVYGMITRQGVGPLVFIDGSMDARLYKEVLRLSVYPTLMRQLREFGEQHSYVDDGASCHDAEATIEFCAQKGIDRPYWPARSPDMNPIEWVWGWIKQKLNNLETRPSTMQELKDKVSEIWYAITPEQILKLYRTMPERVKELEKVRGWHTKY
jgi:transposase